MKDGPITPRQIRAIHAAAHHLGIEDPEYRRLLAQWNVTSSKALTRRQARALLTQLQLRGAPVGRPYSGHNEDRLRIRTLATPAQRALIDRLRAEITWRAPDGYARWLRSRMGLERVRTFQDAEKVIEGLKGLARHE